MKRLEYSDKILRIFNAPRNLWRIFNAPRNLWRIFNAPRNLWRIFNALFRHIVQTFHVWLLS